MNISRMVTDGIKNRWDCKEIPMIDKGKRLIVTRLMATYTSWNNVCDLMGPS